MPSAVFLSCLSIISSNTDKDLIKNEKRIGFCYKKTQIMEDFICSQCEYRSQNLLRLLNHYRYIHNGPRSLITCGLQGCQRVFRSVRSFQVHVKKVHSAFWDRYERLAPENGFEGQGMNEEDGVLSEASSDEEVAEGFLPNQEAQNPLDTDRVASSFILGLREQFKVCDQCTLQRKCCVLVPGIAMVSQLL